MPVSVWELSTKTSTVESVTISMVHYNNRWKIDADLNQPLQHYWTNHYLSDGVDAFSVLLFTSINTVQQSNFHKSVIRKFLMVGCNERIWLPFSIAHFVSTNHIEIGLKFGLYLSFAGLVNKSYPGQSISEIICQSLPFICCSCSTTAARSFWVAWSFMSRRSWGPLVWSLFQSLAGRAAGATSYLYQVGSCSRPPPFQPNPGDAVSADVHKFPTTHNLE